MTYKLLLVDEIFGALLELNSPICVLLLPQLDISWCPNVCWRSNLSECALHGTVLVSVSVPSGQGAVYLNVRDVNGCTCSCPPGLTDVWLAGWLAGSLAS